MQDINLLDYFIDSDFKRKVFEINDNNISCIHELRENSFYQLYVQMRKKKREFLVNLKKILTLLEPGGQIIIYFPSYLWISLEKLRENGLDDIHLYWVFPNRENPIWIMPLLKRNISFFCIDHVFRTYPLLERLIKKCITIILFNMGMFKFLFPKVLCGQRN